MESRKPASAVPTVLLIVALVASAGLIGVGIYRATVAGDWALVSAGSLGVIVTLAAWAATATAGMLVSRGDGRAETDARLAALAERLDVATGLLARISDQQLLSDRAKAVAFREKDRDALRKAIQEEINRGDWDAADRLADEIEQAFGYRSEAAKFRGEVRSRRQEQVRRQVQEVVDVIDRHTRSENWGGALREAERLAAQFPDDERVRGLPAEIERRRQDHKGKLLDIWHESVAKHDTDNSIETLRQLDTYLTPTEAAGMEDSVRQVFKEKREQLAKQFGDAVHEHKWLEAIRAGDAIVREFPETRMAQEVREKMPALRQQAAAMGASAIVPAGV